MAEHYSWFWASSFTSHNFPLLSVLFRRRLVSRRMLAEQKKAKDKLTALCDFSLIPYQDKLAPVVV
jgi:hypothetical protein